MKAIRLIYPFVIFSSVASFAILLIALPAAQTAPADTKAANASLVATERPQHLASAVPAAQKPEVRFAEGVASSTGGVGAGAFAIGDLNGDGIPDLAVALYCLGGDACGSGTSGGVSVMLGNGDGTFQSPVVYAVSGYGATSVSIGDLNGDGYPDLVVGDWLVCYGYFGTCNGGVSVLLNNGDGTFQPDVTYTSNGFNVSSIAIADVNGDGILDVVIGNGCSDSRNQCYLSSVDVLVGNGDGTFQPAVSYSTGLYIASIAIGDVNGDGYPDVVATGEGAPYSQVAVLLNNGEGTFQTPVTYDSGGTSPSSIAIGDINADGKPDLVASNWCLTGEPCHSGIDVLLGNGDGTFQAPVGYRTGGWRDNSVAIGDLNGDGIPDLAVGDWLRCDTCSKSKSDITVLVGNGDGTFQSPVHFSPGAQSNSTWVAIGDVNGDGRPDLVTTYGNSIAVMLNSFVVKTTTVLTSAPNPSTVNQPVTFTATVSSPRPIPDGQVVTFSQGKTQLGTGTIVGGVATLTTSFPKVKSYVIKASYPESGYLGSSDGTVKQVISQSTSSALRRSVHAGSAHN
jgi:hypothetical protein